MRPLANAHTRASCARFLLPIFLRVKVKPNLAHNHNYLSQMRKTRAHLGAENIREKKNKMEKNKKNESEREKKINHAPRCFARTTPTLGTLSREERRRTCLYSLLKKIKGVLFDVRVCGKCEEIRIDLSNCRFQCMVSFASVQSH